MSKYEVLRQIGVPEEGAKCVAQVAEEKSDLLGADPTFAVKNVGQKEPGHAALDIHGENGTVVHLGDEGGSIKAPPGASQQDRTWTPGGIPDRLFRAFEPCRSKIFKLSPTLPPKM